MWLCVCVWLFVFTCEVQRLMPDVFLDLSPMLYIEAGLEDRT